MTYKKKIDILVARLSSFPPFPYFRRHCVAISNKLYAPQLYAPRHLRLLIASAMNAHHRPVVQTNRATGAAHCVWKARENKPVAPESIIRSVYCECLTITKCLRPNRKSKLRLT